MGVFHAEVCPKQKKVRIKRGNTILKSYNFKMDIPRLLQKKTRVHEDLGAWSVSEREWTETYEEMDYCQKTIKDIKQRAIAYYNQQNT